MKTNLLAFLGVVALAILAAGCYSKVGGGYHAGVPFVKDRVVGRYERSLPDVYNAAKQVITANGTLISATELYSQTNAVQTLDGQVNQRHVGVRVEQVDSNLTQVTVQARTSGGGSDLDLAHELEKEIALKLVR